MSQAGAEAALDAALRDPSFYSPEPDRVDVVETHISNVYLAGDLVLKVKKPLVLPFLDYGTPARRLHMCEEEVRLNRRLAPSVYLGVRALVPDEGGPLGWRLSDDPGDPGASEYAVAMRRFDEHHTLAGLVDDDRARHDDLHRLGGRLAAFHLSAGVPRSAGRWPSGLERAVSENFETLAALPGSGISRRQLSAGQRFSAAFLAGWSEVLAARAEQGFVRDGHGDLRAEHVLTEGPEFEVFDCVEFDSALREIDVGADLAFLVMDLAAAHRDDLADALLAGYRKEGGDPGPDRLVAFFTAYRAWVRAKVDALRAAELEEGHRRHGSEDDEAVRLARLARRLAWRARGTQLVLVGGAAASGKSFLAGHLATAAGLAHLESDRVRKELLGIPAGRRAPEDAYTAAQNERTYRELGRRAGDLLREGRSVVAAATFRFSGDRDAFFAGLGRQAAETLFVECRAPVAVLRARAEGRLAGARSESDAGPELAARQVAEFEPLGQDESGEHLALRTDRPVEEIADDVEACLDAWLATAPVGVKPQSDRGLGPTPGRAGGAKLPAMSAQLKGEAPTEEPVLRRRVADVMSPGCVTIPANATPATAAAAIDAHRVHAILVVEPKECTPLGWVTARGLARGTEYGRRQALVEGLIDEQVTAIDGDRSVKVARYALSLAGVTRLLVRSPDAVAPEGVVTERDIAHASLLD